IRRSWAYNRFGVLMGTSWRASGPRWPSLRGDVLPMRTLFPSQGDFCATAINGAIVRSDLTRAAQWLPQVVGVTFLGYDLVVADYEVWKQKVLQRQQAGSDMS